MKTTKRNKTYGHTIVELMIASTIFLIAIGITYTIWTTISGNFTVMIARVEARQTIRNVSAVLTNDIRNAAYIFPGLSVTINGIPYETPEISRENTSGDKYETQTLILAIPEKASGDMTYTIIGYYLSEASTDAENPHTRNLMRYEVNGVKPLIPNIPSSVDLTAASLSNSKNLKKVAGYIQADRFKFRLDDSGQTVEIRSLSMKRIQADAPMLQSSIIFRESLKN